MTRVVLALLSLAAAGLAAPTPKAKPVFQPPVWTLPEDATAIGRVNLRALLDLEPVREVVLTADTRRQVKDWSLATEFRFDPLDDVDVVTFTRHGANSPEWMTAAHGRFRSDRPNRSVELDWLGETWSAAGVSNTALAIGRSKDAIAPALKPAGGRKPAVGDLIPKDGDKLLAWVAVTWPDELRTSEFWKTIGVEVPEKLWAASPGFVVCLEAVRGDWRFVLHIPTADTDSAKGWAKALKQTREAMIRLTPLAFGGISPRLTPVLNAVTKGLGEVTVNGTDVSIDLTIPEKAVRPVLSAFFPDS